ncbi:cytochrome c oxidase, subunit VIa [Kockiozyma suomiensis]|uniref:cytochrome c oxidase, subunit VIa n=1 Tax=Kockiozyma suomiensis TaxID=1337062 RepID=UPI003343D862
MSSLLRARIARPLAARPSVQLFTAAARRNIHEIYTVDEAKAKAFIDEEVAVEEHAGATAGLWYKISLFLAIPLCAAAIYRSYGMEKEHIHHLKHDAEHYDEDSAPNEFVYQNIRNKDFFWGDGDKTAFWSDLANHHKR